MTTEEKGLVIGRLLLPDSVVKEIEEQYGISRQRISAIFKKETGSTYQEAKQALFNEKFRCIVCGGPLNIKGRIEEKRTSKIYCSPDCEKFGKLFDVNTETVCKYKPCGTIFYQYRNWKWVHKRDYCCLSHYKLDQAEKAKGGEYANDSNK